MRSVRCSALPRVFACPASADATGIIWQSNAAAETGNSVHEIAESIVRNDLSAPPRETPEGLEFFARGIVAVWSKLKELIRPILTETQMSVIVAGVELRGKADAIFETMDEPSSIVVLDWKTFDGPNDYRHQLMGYAALVRRLYPHLPIKIVTAYAQSRSYIVEAIADEVIGEWEKELEGKLAEKEKYVVGFHCRYCPAAATCKTRKEALEQAATQLIAAPETALTSREMFVETYDRMQLIRTFTDRYYATLKNTLMTEGPLTLPNGNTLSLEQEERESIRAESLPDLLSQNEISKLMTAGALSVSKKEFLAEMSKGAARGKTQAVREEVMDRLRAVGGTEKSVIQKIKEKKNDDRK